MSGFKMKPDLGNKTRQPAYAAERGTRPRAVKQQQFEYVYLFGSVCPNKGIGEAMVNPWVNKDIMVEHSATGKGRHAIVMMDGATWHTEDIAKGFNNVSVIKVTTLFTRAKSNRTSMELVKTTLSSQPIVY